MSSILLKRILNGDLTGVSVILFSWFICVLALALTKGCSNIEEKPRYSKLATGGAIVNSTNGSVNWDEETLWVDSVKPPKINHRLILSGSDTTFRFLVFAIQNPLDVTPNQKTQLLQWINNSLKQDTTKQK